MAPGKKSQALMLEKGKEGKEEGKGGRGGALTYSTIRKENEEHEIIAPMRKKKEKSVGSSSLLS